MSTFTNDPKFTAYALGEMNETEANVFRTELLESGIDEQTLQREVDEINDFKERLSDEFAKDDQLRLPFEARDKLGSKNTVPWFKRFFVGSLSTGILSLVLIFGLFKTKDFATRELKDLTKGVFGKAESWNDSIDGAPSSSETAELEKVTAAPVLAESKVRARRKGGNNLNFAPSIGSRGAKKKLIGFDGAKVSSRDWEATAYGKPEVINREDYDHIESSGYISVRSEPLSTFSIDVDTASYANIRRFIDGGSLPPKHSIRVEELVNYFPYNYNVDYNDHPIGVKVDQMTSPFNKGRKVVRIAMKASMPKRSVGKNLVFLLDVSGSMNAANKLPLLKESLKIVMRELKPTDTISLVVYAGAAGVVLEPTPVKNRLKIRQALNKLSAGGSTNGGAGIEAAYKLAKSAFIEGGVNRVILATDGDFNVGTSNRGGLVDLVKEKAKQNIFLTVLGFGMGNYQDAMLEEISNKGNGNYAYIDNLSEANKVFKYDLEKNMTTVAKDVKLQVEFNPKFVQAYRLIGYENRALAAKDFNDDKKDAGEMGAGHTVTALYELIGHDEKIPLVQVDSLKYAAKTNKVVGNSHEILNVKVRYKKPTESVSNKFEVPLKNVEIKASKVDQEMIFATSVAAWGLKLRGDEMAKNISYKEIRSMANKSRGKDVLGLRSEFLDLVDFTIGLTK
jgi:Ca-activated chloride channel family protein